MFVRDGVPDWWTEAWSLWFVLRIVLRDFAGLILLVVVVNCHCALILMLERGLVRPTPQLRRIVRVVMTVALALVLGIYLWVQLALVTLSVTPLRMVCLGPPTLLAWAAAVFWLRRAFYLPPWQLAQQSLQESES